VSDANVVKLVQSGSFADPLTELLRNGARALLAQAVEAEVADFLAKHVDVKTAWLLPNGATSATSGRSPAIARSTKFPALIRKIWNV